MHSTGMQCNAKYRCMFVTLIPQKNPNLGAMAVMIGQNIRCLTRLTWFETSTA